MKRAMALLCLSILAVGMAQKQAASQQAVAPTVGLSIGAKAPAFALRDQFGRDQSNATLKGPHGTVLLFFRSADW